jgi:hypothetical protein
MHSEKKSSMHAIIHLHALAKKRISLARSLKAIVTYLIRWLVYYLLKHTEAPKTNLSHAVLYINPNAITVLTSLKSQI